MRIAAHEYRHAIPGSLFANDFLCESIIDRQTGRQSTTALSTPSKPLCGTFSTASPSLVRPMKVRPRTI